MVIMTDPQDERQWSHRRCVAREDLLREDDRERIEQLVSELQWIADCASCARASGRLGEGLDDIVRDLARMGIEPRDDIE